MLGEELYFIAAEIVTRALLKKATIKSLCYSAPLANKKKLLALGALYPIKPIQEQMILFPMLPQ